MDESGDLGFGSKGSKYFILACVRINDDETHIKFRRIPKEVRERTLTKKAKKQSELKFSNSSLLIRERFLSRVAKLNVEVLTLIIEKRLTQKQLQENLPILYNYLIKILLEKAFSGLPIDNKLILCLDKSMSQIQGENFEAYVKTEFVYLFNVIPSVEILHESSNHNECLQVVDFICGAFGYKYNTSNLSGDFDYYTNIINNNIKIEKNDLFKEKANHTY